MATIGLKGEIHDLYSGILHKCGGKVKTWNKRFFVLKSDYCLYYFKDTTKGALGSISLRDPKFSVRKGEANDISWPRGTKLDTTMAIVTSHRTYLMFCNYSHEIDEWIRMLMDTKEKMNGNQNELSSSNSQSKQTSSTMLQSCSGSDELSYEPVYDSPSENKKKPIESQTQSSSTEAVYALATSVEVQEQPLYEDVSDPSTSQIPAPSVLYEPVDIQSEEQKPSTHESDVMIYDDIEAEIAQPLYEDIIIKAAECQNDDLNDHPPLPPKSDDLPNDSPSLLPGSDDLPIDGPPLPPRSDDLPDDSPPLPSRSDDLPNDSPFLPSTNDIHQSSPGQFTPPSSDTSMECKTTPTNHVTASGKDTPPRRPSTSSSEGKKPSPLPRRRSSSSPKQSSYDCEKPVAKPRARNGDSGGMVEQVPSEELLGREQGMVLFQNQKKRLEVLDQEDTKRHDDSIRMLEDVSTDPTVSSSKKALFAETLREVEHERLLASEERFKWERERKKLEEERLQFEEEKRQLEMMMQQTY